METGHATSAEKAHIAALNEKLRTGSITPDEQLELALLNLEPLHDGFKAGELLQELLAANPRHEIAKLWLAYVHIYEFMDRPSLVNAVRLCDDLFVSADQRDTLAAAHLLKTSALCDLAFDSKQRAASNLDPMLDLRLSVARAPTWPGSRLSLAHIYEKRGDLLAAQDQLREALETSGSRPPLPDYASRMFEMLITQRGSERTIKLLKSELQRLTAKTRDGGR
jgi:tetratricopeptide (TPR) repeat protein